jgi:hypothetical protein
MSEPNAANEIPQAEHGVDPELIKKLHDANEQFSRARHHVEKALEAEVNVQTERERALDEIAEAEKTVEETEAKIEKDLKKNRPS